MISTPDSSDDGDDSFCAAGLQLGDICCAATCTACGGPGCGSMVGGPSGCCAVTIRESGNICELPSDTGCVMDTTTISTPDSSDDEDDDDDSFCAAGIPLGDICCASTCSACGGPGCGSMVGGPTGCCESNIRDSGNICELPNDTGCVMMSTTVTTEHYPKRMLMDPEPMLLMSSARGGSFSAIYLFCIVSSFFILLTS